MNKFIISSLRGATLLGLILGVISLVSSLSNVLLNTPSKIGKENRYIETAVSQIPVSIQLSFLKDTSVNFKEKEGSKIQIGSGGFYVNSEYDKRDTSFSKFKEKIVKYGSDAQIDTLVGNFIVFPSENHPSRQGLENIKPEKSTESSTGKKIYGVYKIPPFGYDSLVKNPIFKVENITQITGIAKIKATNKRDQILLSSPTWLAHILILLLVYQLYRILDNVYIGKFFERSNIIHIQTIGFLLIGMFALTFFTIFFYDYYLISHITHRSNYISQPYKPLGEQVISGFSMSLYKEINFTNLYVGLITLILATIFKRGLSLQQEQDLTV